jgi:hypothetical protein
MLIPWQTNGAYLSYKYLTFTSIYEEKKQKALTKSIKKYSKYREKQDLVSSIYYWLKTMMHELNWETKPVAVKVNVIVTVASAPRATIFSVLS